MAAASKASISKIDAVRRAIKELGKKEAMPGAIQQFVKEKFGLEMSIAHVSNYKSLLLNKKKKGKKAEVAASVESTPATAVAPAKPAGAASNGSTVSLHDLEAVKDLVGRVGEDNLKSLIGLLG
jgi:hypothetical protein